MLTKVKDTLPLEKQSRVVYQIPCSCGQVYIGEIIKLLQSRVKEHQEACERGMLEKSAASWATSFSVSSFALFIAATPMLVSSADGKFETQLKYLNRAMVRFHCSEIDTSIVHAQPRGAIGQGQYIILYNMCIYTCNFCCTN